MADDYEEKKKLYDDLEKVAKNLPPELAPDLQKKVVENLKKWNKRDNKSLSILLTGKTGAGKSTLINGILGWKKDDKNAAKEGDKISKRCTTEVIAYYQEKNGVDVNLWDSPGLQDGTDEQEDYLEQMKEKCSNVDFVMYCIKLTETRFVRSPDNPDFEAMRKITDAFGHDFWRKTVIVLTYANVLESMNPKWEDLSDEKRAKAFNDKIKEWEDQIKVILSKDIGVPNKIIDNLEIVPAGHERKPHLAGVEYWLSNLWFRCFYSITSSDTRCAMLQVNLKRFKKVTMVKKEDFQKDAEKQPIVVSDNTMRNVVIGGVSGGVSGGVIGGVIGGLLGGPIGAGVGASIGVLLGGGGGMFANHQLYQVFDKGGKSGRNILASNMNTEYQSYVDDAHGAVSIADLSTEVTYTTRSIDNVDYGLSLDIDPSSLSSNSTPVVADIKVYTVSDDDDKVPFTFPSETKPMSAVYSISLQSVPVHTLKIRHCANPNNPEELEHLTFVKSSSDSSSKFEIVPGGVFRLGEQYGEITPPHMCLWSIVGWISEFLMEESRYVGTILYQTVKHHPDQWLLQLMVAKHDPTSTLALNEYILSQCGHDVIKETEFLFKFKSISSVKPKLVLMMEEHVEQNQVLRCRNGWEISLDIYEISRDTVDHFKRSTDVPGRCKVIIHTHMNVCDDLAELPRALLSGIISDKKSIIINPPIPAAAAKFEDKSSQLIIAKDEVPTGKAVFDLMKNYSARWDEFGRELEIPHNYRLILHDERISAEARLERVIYKWIESHCSPVTWDHLIKVLERMKLQIVIDDIKTSISMFRSRSRSTH